MIKHILLVMFFVALLSPSARCDDASGRGMYVSVVQDPQILESREEISRLIKYAKKAGIKILFVQVYRSNQAWFPSKVADDSPYQICLKKTNGDPLTLLIKEAHANGLEVHAWLNLLSLGANKDAMILKKYGTDILTRNMTDKKELQDYKIDNQYFLEPGDSRVQKYLLKVVEEILHAYPKLDGIQFDYIRYPDTNPHYGYTSINVERYKKASRLNVIDDSSQSWNNWKRAQVTGLLSKLVKKVRSRRPRIQVSATGCMPYARAYHEALQDWPSWVNTGLVDFVAIMNYSENPVEFERWNQEAKSKVTDFSKVKISVGAYKFERVPGTFRQIFRNCEKFAGSCVIFNYGSLRQHSDLAETLAGVVK